MILELYLGVLYVVVLVGHQWRGIEVVGDQIEHLASLILISLDEVFSIQFGCTYHVMASIV